MSLISAQQIAHTFAANTSVANLQLEGITHAESLVQPPFNANCLNWVMGHIVASRNRALALLNQPPVWDEATAARYVTGSDPVKDGSDALPLERIVADFHASTDQIKAALAEAAQDFLDEIVDHERNQTRGQRLAGLAWHETYHVGQTDLLRQLAGKNDKVV